MGRHKGEVQRRVTNRISHPHAHSALIPHLTQAHSDLGGLQPPHLRRLISKHKDHYSGHANVSGDDVDITRAVEGSCRDGNGMAERGEVGDEVGSPKEGICNWGNFLKAEDEDVRRSRVSESREEVRREDIGVDGFAATVESYYIRIESGHSCGYCW